MKIAYKAFRKDLTCTMGKGIFRYEPGRWYEEQEAKCASTGFHCAEDPLDCLNYYRDMDQSTYWIVMVDGDIDEDNYDSRISATRIKLLQELTTEGLVAEAISYMITHPHRTPSHFVARGSGIAPKGERFVIVRGKNPVAMGEEYGAVLGFAMEKPNSGEIYNAGLFVVDGKTILPGVWYDIGGNAVHMAGEAGA